MINSSPNEKLRTIYIDVDRVLIDYQTVAARLSPSELNIYEGAIEQVPGIFQMLEPVPKSIDAIHSLSLKFEVYFLTAVPWEDVSAWGDKILWLKKHLGPQALTRLIVTTHRNLSDGDYLITHKTRQEKQFSGELVLLETMKYPNWDAVARYFSTQDPHMPSETAL